MARRRMTALQRRYFGPRAPRAASPIVIRTNAAPAKRRRFHRTRAALGGIASGGAVGYAVGGLIYGFAVKQGLVQKLPAIPLIGRTGAAAILLDFWARRGGGSMVRQAATAAAVLAGYQLGSTGAITGDFATAGDTDGDDYGFMHEPEE